MKIVGALLIAAFFGVILSVAAASVGWKEAVIGLAASAALVAILAILVVGIMLVVS